MHNIIILQGVKSQLLPYLSGTVSWYPLTPLPLVAAVVLTPLVATGLNPGLA